uniref:Uncharacterized protein n=1 Tax=Bubo bubo TaxID=30461 RepID=A0A8C0ELF6_BUBBB
MSIIPGHQGSLQSPCLLLLAFTSVVSPCTERGWMCCPKGWKRFQKCCYYISDDTMSWAESRVFAVAAGSVRK